MIEAGFSYLEHLLFLSLRGEAESLGIRLMRPLDLSGLPEGEAGRALEELLRKLDESTTENPALRFLLHLNLLSGFLILGGLAPAGLKRFVTEHIDRASLLPPGTRDAKCWVAVPVAEAVSSHAAIRWWVLGWEPGGSDRLMVPLWAAALLDQDAKQAIEDALQAARFLAPSSAKGGFIVCPLCSPGGRPSIRGRSLGLPLGMAFAALSNGSAPRHPTIVATGDLDPDGRVRRVNMLEIKAACFLKEIRGIHALVYPAENEEPRECRLPETIPVSSLDEALFIRSLYRPGEASRIAGFRRVLNEPGAFASGCANLPPDWLRWAVRHGRHGRVADALLSSQELFEELIARLKTALRDWNLNLSSALCAVLEPDAVQNASSAFPLAAFRWFALNLALANHEGDVGRAEDFASRAAALLERIEEVSPDEAAEYFACRMVAAHNRYRFEPEIPPDLARTLTRLENRYAAARSPRGTGFDLPLGKLYGTIGQNFAFCGPAYLSQALEWFAKARSVLGEGTIPDHEREWMRQLHYAAFACLDAGKVFDAEDYLCRYLKVPSLAALAPESLPPDSRWAHNLLARFLADVGPSGPAERYFEWAAACAFDPPGKEHPWQLWAYNLGRLAFSLGKPQAAAACFRKSLELCLSAKPAVCVMALLPLCGLSTLRGLPEDFPAIAVRIRGAAAGLNPKHFRAFLDQPLPQALEENRERLPEFFPFTYR